MRGVILNLATNSNLSSSPNSCSTPRVANRRARIRCDILANILTVKSYIKSCKKIIACPVQCMSAGKEQLRSGTILTKNLPFETDPFLSSRKVAEFRIRQRRNQYLNSVLTVNDQIILKILGFHIL